MLRIGIIPTVCPYLLPEVAPALRRALPKLQLIWSEDKTDRLLDQIKAADLDAAVLALDGRLSQLTSVPIGDDPFVLAAAPGNRLLQGQGPASPSVLEGATVFLLEDGHCFRDQALSFCTRAGAEEASYRATSLSTLVQMTAGGSGVSLLPSVALDVENRRQALATRPFAAKAPERTIVLVFRKGSALEPALKAVGETLREGYVALGSN